MYKAVLIRVSEKDFNKRETWNFELVVQLLRQWRFELLFMDVVSLANNGICERRVEIHVIRHVLTARYAWKPPQSFLPMMLLSTLFVMRLRV